MENLLGSSMEEMVRLCPGTANPSLVRGISKYLKLPVIDVNVSCFKDGETFVRIRENVRSKDVFVIQPTSPPVNSHLMELLVMLDALKRSSVGSITLVMPYYGYSRQDRKVEPRVPITAKLVADLLEAAGADRIMTVDLHAGQIQGFFNMPVDNLYAAPVLLNYVKQKQFSNPIIVSPDAGGAARARGFAKRLNTGLAIIDKRRSKPNEAKAMNIIGDVHGKEAIIVDDMIDTAGTLCEAASALKKAGATKILACATHGVFSSPAIKRIAESDLEELVVTDTISHAPEDLCEKISVISVAGLVGEAIKRVFEGSSVSELFKDKPINSIFL